MKKERERKNEKLSKYLCEQLASGFLILQHFVRHRVRADVELLSIVDKNFVPYASECSVLFCSRKIGMECSLENFRQ